MMKYLICMDETGEFGPEQWAAVERLVLRRRLTMDKEKVIAELIGPDTTLERLWEILAEWSDMEFGTVEQRGPIGPLKHILQEVTEEMLGHSIDMRVRDAIKQEPRESANIDRAEYGG